MRLRVPALLVVLALGGGVVGVGGCGTDYVDFGRECTPEEARRWGCEICPYSCVPDTNDAGSDASDAGADASDAGEPGATCDGQCVHITPVNFTGYVLLWIGPVSEIPACPPQAQQESGYDWYTDLQAPPAPCGACSCMPSVGSCTLPTKLTVSSATCGGAQSGAETASFDAPAGWDGSCTFMDKFDEGKSCGGIPCVASITLAPLNVTAGLCMPVSAGASKLPEPTSWGTAGKVCRGSSSGRCGDQQDVCMPASEPGFKRCVYHEGNVPCADETPYVDRHVLYTDVSDTRGCANCTCGDTVGSACSSSISIFEDDACSVPIPFTNAINSAGPGCHDLPAGVPLGSKSAGPVIYTPGFCPPEGGGPTGDAVPLNPTTYCCLPEP